MQKDEQPKHQHHQHAFVPLRKTRRGTKISTGKERSRRPLVLALTMAIAGVLFVTVLAGPGYLVERRHFELTPKDRLDAEAGIRSSLIQLFGGAIFLAGLYFTAQAFRLTREGHITDRYTGAIEQLGNTNVDVRIGGIFALERLARDSRTDCEAIVDVLATFIREHTRTGPRNPSTAQVEVDVQTALMVIGRRPHVDSEIRRLDFYHSGLNGAELQKGDFSDAMFYYSRLDDAHFSGAKLPGADLSFCMADYASFTKCSAQGAHFVNAKYTNSWFLSADLTHSDFSGCDLTNSDFGRRYAEEGVPPFPPAILSGANFSKANLNGTNLRGVDLRSVRGLTRKQLAVAIVDENTLLPDELTNHSPKPTPLQSN